MSEPLNINEEFKKARKWTSDTLLEATGQPRREVKEQTARPTNVDYANVVRELLAQVDRGCDIIPIDSSFSYEDLMKWVSSHAKGNKVVIIHDTLKNSTGQVLAVAFAQDDMLLLSGEMPKACFIYKTLNPSIQDLFPKGMKVYIKQFKFV